MLVGTPFSDPSTAENGDAEFQSPHVSHSPQGDESDSAVTTPQSQTSSSTESGGTLSHARTQLEFELEDTYDDSEPPRRFKLLSNVYNETEAEEQEHTLSDTLLFTGIEEPVNYTQAAKEKVWQEAMDCEIDAIERNKTWALTDLPVGHKAIDLKWVYKVKRDTNGKILKHKARLVAKGYVQK